MDWKFFCLGALKSSVSTGDLCELGTITVTHGLPSVVISIRNQPDVFAGKFLILRGKAFSSIPDEADFCLG